MDSYSWTDRWLTWSFVLRTGVALWCVVLLFAFSSHFFQAGKQIVWQATMSAVKTIGAKIGDPMIQDDFGNINALIAGYGGDDHDGGLLMDTIMVASYNPDLWAVTFLSIPRDLYVSYGEGRSGRINGVFWTHYLRNNRSFDAGISALQEKVEEITWLDIPYYMTVDFDGLVRLIDELWGIKVFAHEAIYDTMYPWPNHTYTTFSLPPGEQVLDGDTALKYARSRYSTSDFSRSLRQQQIIQGMVQAILPHLSVTNPNSVRDWYQKFVSVITTNVTFREVMWLTPQMNDDRHYFSFVYTIECSRAQPRLMQPGCVLYVPRRDLFNNMSVILPNGATVSNVSYYLHTQDIASWLVHRQEHLIENAYIGLLNGIDRNVVRERGLRMPALANPIWVEMVLRGLQVTRSANTDTVHEVTTAYIRGVEGSYPATRDALSIFIDLADEQYVFVDPESGERNNPTGASLLGDEDIVVVFGNDYLE